jgi:hypothetical protein
MQFQYGLKVASQEKLWSLSEKDGWILQKGTTDC